MMKMEKFNQVCFRLALGVWAVMIISLLVVEAFGI